jgi:hypothetical protein
MATQRDLARFATGLEGVGQRYIFGSDGFFYTPKDFFFAALSRGGSRLTVSLRLSAEHRETLGRQSWAGPHPMLREDWMEAVVGENSAEIRQWIETAWKDAQQAASEAPKVPQYPTGQPSG